MKIMTQAGMVGFSNADCNDTTPPIISEWQTHRDSLDPSISGINANTQSRTKSNQIPPPEQKKPANYFFPNKPRIFLFSLSASPTGASPPSLSCAGFLATCSLPAPPRPVW